MGTCIGCIWVSVAADIDVQKARRFHKRCPGDIKANKGCGLFKMYDEYTYSVDKTCKFGAVVFKRRT